MCNIVLDSNINLREVDFIMCKVYKRIGAVFCTFGIILMFIAGMMFNISAIANYPAAGDPKNPLWGHWFQMLFAAAMVVLAVILVIEGIQTFVSIAKKEKKTVILLQVILQIIRLICQKLCRIRNQ